MDQHSPNNERGSKIDDANLFNGKAAEGKGIKGLDTILRHQFGDVREEAQGEGDRTPKTQLEEDKARRMSLASESFAEDMAKQKKGYKESLLALISSGAFTGFFLLLTMYTFYAPDLDVIFGGKESEVVMGVTMTVTLAFFLLELVLNSIAKPQYVCRFPFWLDLAASLSLLPETWMWKQILRSNFIASGDESITRFLMLAARSTRVSRLQRLTRLMRIAALLPRITQQLQRVNRQLEADARTLLDKKLHRVFAFLDQDYDGKISHSALKEVLRRFDPAMRKSTNSRRKITNLSFFSGKTSIRSISDVEEAGEEELRPEDRSKASRQVSEHSMGAKQLRFTEEQEVNRELSNFSIGIPIPRAKTDGTETQDSEEEPLERIESSASNTSEHLPFHDRDAGHKSTKSSVASWISEDLKGVTFDEFREQILAEDWVDKQLLSVCRNELMKTSYMHKERVKQMEDIGVKVALGVLCNILVVSLFSWSFTDFSARLSLSMLDAQGRRFPDVQTLPESLQDSVLLWSQSLDPQSLRGSLIFLDVAQRTVCNELDQGVSCTAEHDPWPWPERGSLTAVDQAFQRSSHRQSDVVLLRVPDDSERSAATSLEDLNRSVTSLALLNMRYLQEQNAIFSVAVTTTAIILILVGIYVFTREISVLSSGLLRPLRLLADDMQSVTQMQLAGLQSNKAVMEFDRNVAEIRLIEGIFEKTKTAIRSWGKYVPWPVVQILLAAGIDSALKLATTDVTMFFSDIASFTTIVEKLPPERSLVLLSRYFNDMSQVIDNHGGIVIEFIGDAILSVFGAPLRNPMHADACVRATLKMLKALDRINAWSKHRSLPQVNIRCGVHTGEVLVGNMGFHSRIKYGTMGENANVPSKLEEFNKTYSTFNLISEDTYLSLPPETFIVRPIDCIYLRNSDPEPTTVYNVLGFNESAEKMGKTERIEKMSQVYQDAYNNYRRQSFKKASDLFQKYVRMSKKMGPQDSAAQLMQKRCKFYLENPPSREWDGVWDQAHDP